MCVTCLKKNQPKVFERGDVCFSRSRGILDIYVDLHLRRRLTVDPHVRHKVPGAGAVERGDEVRCFFSARRHLRRKGVVGGVIHVCSLVTSSRGIFNSINEGSKSENASDDVGESITHNSPSPPRAPSPAATSALVCGGVNRSRTSVDATPPPARDESAQRQAAKGERTTQPSQEDGADRSRTPHGSGSPMADARLVARLRARRARADAEANS